MTLPTWASYTPAETRAARPNTNIPPDLTQRLNTLAAMPGLTPRQKAILTHRAPAWLKRFNTLLSQPTPLSEGVTFEQARALYHAVSWNGISSPYAADQIAKGITPAQLARTWHISLAQARAATTRRHRAWWQTKVRI